MIRKLKYKIILLFLLAASFASCKKEFLDLVPPAALTPDVALGTEADLLVALRGAYAGTRGVDYHGRTLPIIGDPVSYTHLTLPTILRV